MSAATLDSIPTPEPLTADELPPFDVEPSDFASPEPAPADSKPKRTRRASSTPRERKPRARGAVAQSQAKRVSESVAGLHQLAGELVLPMAGMPVTGAALVSQADAAGAVWAQLANRYPAIARLFTASGDGLLFAQLAMVYMPVITAALAETSARDAGASDAALAGFMAAATPPASPFTASPFIVSEDSAS